MFSSSSSNRSFDSNTNIRKFHFRWLTIIVLYKIKKSQFLELRKFSNYANSQMYLTELQQESECQPSVNRCPEFPVTWNWKDLLKLWNFEFEILNLKFCKSYLNWSSVKPIQTLKKTKLIQNTFTNCTRTVLRWNWNILLILFHLHYGERPWSGD